MESNNPKYWTDAMGCSSGGRTVSFSRLCWSFNYLIFHIQGKYIYIYIWNFFFFFNSSHVKICFVKNLCQLLCTPSYTIASSPIPTWFSHWLFWGKELINWPVSWLSSRCRWFKIVPGTYSCQWGLASFLSSEWFWFYIMLYIYIDK